MHQGTYIQSVVIIKSLVSELHAPKLCVAPLRLDSMQRPPSSLTIVLDKPDQVFDVSTKWQFIHIHSSKGSVRSISMTTLEDCVRGRHSTRFFKSDPVPPEILERCLSLAQLAPSNSNIQNWRMAIASEHARDRIVSSLKAEAAKHGPNVPPLPDHFKHFRSEFGHLLYGEKGYNIPREDANGMQTARMRNYEFFGAPCCAVISMDRGFAESPVDAMSVGMFIQIFMLALAESGLGSCLQISVTGYPEVLKEGFGLGDDQLILCGMAIGWPVEGNAVNEMVVPRENLKEQITFLRD